jgi:hypothetical protein
MMCSPFFRLRVSSFRNAVVAEAQHGSIPAHGIIPYSGAGAKLLSFTFLSTLKCCFGNGYMRRGATIADLTHVTSVGVAVATW